MQKEMKRLKGLHTVIAAFGLSGLVVTFLLASSALELQIKLLGVIGIAAVFVVLCIISYRLQRPPADIAVRSDKQNEIQSIEEKLLSLDEAHEFFGASLKPPDMFRLVSCRVADIFPFAASILFLVSENKERLLIAQADGKNVELTPNTSVAIDIGIAGRAVSSGSVEFTDAMDLEIGSMPDMQGFSSAAAIPLMRENEVFGIFQVFTDSLIVPDKWTTQLLEAVGTRIAPIFSGSMAFERSLANALTDPLTSLPNERAFYMVLENQLAESQRYREERPLTVLAIDIKDFADANLSFGHAMGDRVLTFVAGLVKEQLRKMDFLARSINDEFVVILPTANEKTALEIVERIKISFVNNPFEISEAESIKIWLNFGWATFWQDGETAPQLLQNAQLRKQQAKSAEPSKVLWFPKEYVN